VTTVTVEARARRLFWIRPPICILRGEDGAERLSKETAGAELLLRDLTLDLCASNLIPPVVTPRADVRFSRR
jgi:hypothetical protein